MSEPRRSFLKTLGAGAIALPLANPLATQAQQRAPDAGIDFKVIDPVQPTDAPGKIEIVEFFWYGCPHCFAFEPALDAWVKKLPNDTAFRRVPAQFNPTWASHARLFYALEATGDLNRLHKVCFNTIHIEKQQLVQESDQLEWYAKNGGDRQKFADALKSFGVQGKLRRAAQMMNGFRLEGVPALAVNGKYLTAPSIAGNQEKCLQVMDYLLDAERKGRRA